MDKARHMCFDIKKFYLTAALEYFKYMKIPISLFPTWTIEQYKLNKLAVDGWVYIEMRHAIWGLSQAGILANKRLRQKLSPFGCHKSVNTPGLWMHESRSITFTFVVDNFGVEFVNKDNVNHLISSIKKVYTVTKDWTGDLYCDITLEWDYVGQTVDISMPGYTKTKLQEYGNIMPKKITTVSILAGTKEIWNRGTGTPPPQLVAKT
jgi:hypothetical protein